MKLADILGLSAIVVYVAGEIVLATKLAPHCDRHVRDWGDLSLRGPDACVEQRRVAFQVSPKETTR